MADTAGLSRVAAEVAALIEAEREAAELQYRAKWRDSGRNKPWKNRKDRRGERQYTQRFQWDSSRYKKTFFYKNNEHFRKPIQEVDINAADSAQWERLPGIGPTLAKRIVGFRERLGGFYATAQVGEVYGLADSVFKKIQPFLRLGDVSLRKISLNDTDEKSLALHPYINTNMARVIVRYRSAHGPFRAVEALHGLALVDDSIYRKIEKYLTVN
nr:helix-hairpin-helix domain-containing protein [Chitinophaga chungangae]